jgi:hypothetical protein
LAKQLQFPCAFSNIWTRALIFFVLRFCAACVLCIPNFVVAVFSTGRRASSLLLEQVLSMLRRFSDYTGTDINDRAKIGSIMKSNQETVW